jgi:uncharacterized protein YndB with AHSA1/START domain
MKLGGVVWKTLTDGTLISQWLMPTYGSRLDSLVTWTLTAVEGGTRLRLVHSGFRSPENDFAFEAMSGGWGRVTPKYFQGGGRARSRDLMPRVPNPKA